MRTAYSVLLALLLVTTVAAQPVAPKSSLKFSDGEKKAAIAVDAALSLNAGEVLVVQDDAMEIRAYPTGILKITKSAGPKTLFAKFAGGNGDYEERTFDGKVVAVVQPLASGDATLVVRPASAKSEADWVDRAIKVNLGPRPPPTPTPEPLPPVPPPAPVSSFRALFVYESSVNLTPAQSSVIYGKAVQEYLTAKTTKEANGFTGWNRLDKDSNISNDTPNLKAMWEATKPKITKVPCVAIEVNGKVTIEDLPATPTDAIALFKKYTGEK